MAADIMNVYITAPNRENIWALVGPEFVMGKGCKAVVVRAFYELKSSITAFRSHLADCVRKLGNECNKVDPYL